MACLTGPAGASPDDGGDDVRRNIGSMGGQASRAIIMRKYLTLSSPRGAVNMFFTSMGREQDGASPKVEQLHNDYKDLAISI